MRKANILPPPASPCVNICRLDAASGLCDGCLRTLEEIGVWSASSAEEKEIILRRIQARLERFSADN